MKPKVYQCLLYRDENEKKRNETAAHRTIALPKLFHGLPCSLVANTFPVRPTKSTEYNTIMKRIDAPYLHSNLSSIPPPASSVIQFIQTPSSKN
ncbi:hypothetical protein ElyMa_003218900 [Elysia marginata]|uniref:Uncharacterized protein n=1 Tax=Elysia marginata TaxID=1093978 RepID=A0AAV4J3T9_9GAST|nr:hypothetical protein ElyMa_003218900 [Elysia marginata]